VTDPTIDPMDLWKQAGGGTPDFSVDRWRALIDGFLGEGSEFPGPDDVTWALLKELADKPHPLIRVDDSVTSGLHYGVVEVLYAAKVVHHLLDLADVPRGYSMDTRDIDARTLLAVRGVMTLRERLARISAWHARETGPAGTVGDFCICCGDRWPCDTRRMADGVYTDPEDDEPGSSAAEKAE
jgi:hypothetical protein